jgi:hypothetical protein
MIKNMARIPREIKDDGFKLILGNHDLFVQFLNDFVKIDLLNDVTPDDIDDITERFITMGIESQDGDTVKKINIKGMEPLYVVGLAEHQQKVNYRMSFRFLQYNVFIWRDYENEQNFLRKSASELKDFKYPPILPIVYYTGESAWTAPLNFYDKVYFNIIFERYIPKFEYMLIDSNNYSPADLIRNKDILSLFLIIDKIKRAEQISLVSEIPQEYLDELERNTPEHLRKLVREVVYVFLKKLDIPENELNEFTGKIMERGFSEMFGLVDGYSVKKHRENVREELTMETAKNMLLEGLAIELIARVTKLTVDKINDIKDALIKEGKPLV